MREIVEALEALEAVVFVVLALVTLNRWWRTRNHTAAWVAATFAVLATVVVAGRLIPDDPAGVDLWARKALIALLALFPYCLFRFAASFRAMPRLVEVVAAGLTLASAIGILFFRSLPAEDEAAPASFVAYTFLVLAQWTFTSVIVAVRLWSAGTGRTTVVGRRMRTLAIATVTLLAALVLSVAARDTNEQADGVDLAIALLVLTSGPLFLVGFAPPKVLLAMWRAPEEAALYQAEAALMAASDAKEIGAGLLPHVTATTGAYRAVLHAKDGTEIASFTERSRRGPADDEDPEVLSAPMRSGSLCIEGDSYTPFFGRDELAVLRRLANLTDVALQRAEIIERERDAADDLKSANRAIRDFVAVASHDLRTPIAVMKGYASLLSSGGDSVSPEERSQHLDAIVRQADHLSSIVNDLLTVSRLDSGVVDPQPERTVLALLVRDIIRDLGVEDHTSVDLPEELAAFVDPEHASRMLRNLIQNAGVHGAPPIAISGRAVSGRFEVRVRDHGNGVSEDFLPRLFERFARAPEARSRAHHGTGLGLPIVKGLANAAGGDLVFEPASPGACFVLTLPIVRQEQS